MDRWPAVLLVVLFLSSATNSLAAEDYRGWHSDWESSLDTDQIDAPGTPVSATSSADAATAAAGCDACGKSCCTCKDRKKLNKAAAGAYKGLFYNNQFGYLNDPCHDGCLLGENLKQLKPNSYVTVDVGGQYRMRFQSEQNMRGLGLTGVDDDFLLHRTRIYTDVHVGDRFRFYGEYLDATSDFEDFGPRPIDENRSDAINLFSDYLISEHCNGNLYGRAGRQELLYGAQRFVSPLDWANTRRTFDGYKLFWRGDEWDVDGFWTQPVLTDRRNFDAPDQDQEFYGIYSSYKGVKNTTTDLYWLGYSDYASPFAAGRSFKFQTVGARWSAERGAWLAEAEVAYQFGDFGPSDHSAGAFTLGLGRKFVRTAWKPTLWVYYDWASGDETTGNGFNHMFPLGHKYLGFMDFFGRSNLEDLNFLLTAKPCDSWSLLLWWHIFHLQDGDDVPYNVVNRPIAATPGGSQSLGQELDFLAKWTITPRTDLVLGYSHFFTGDWYRTNPSAGLFTGDADFYYTQFTVNF